MMNSFCLWFFWRTVGSFIISCVVAFKGWVNLTASAEAMIGIFCKSAVTHRFNLSLECARVDHFWQIGIACHETFMAQQWLSCDIGLYLRVVNKPTAMSGVTDTLHEYCGSSKAGRVICRHVTIRSMWNVVVYQIESDKTTSIYNVSTRVLSKK